MSKPELNLHASYRADVDGLRAIAVLLVVFFHAWPEWVRGGFVGVDVFFVISGYLISGIIFRQIESGQFSVVDFYAKRVRRIFPSLITVISACLLFGSFALFDIELRQLGKHAAAGVAFVSNMVFFLEVSYWDGAARLKPFLHLWSLGIEEQFYIIWPILLAILWRFTKNILPFLLIFFLASFALNVLFVQARPSAVFYLPVTRFWELLAGGLLALILLRERRVPFFLSHLLPALGLGLIFFSAFILTKDSSFPGWSACLPVLGALAILAGKGGFLNRVVLSHRILVYVGLISYPLYLWHWPLISFAHILFPAGLSQGMRLLLVVAAFILSAATFRWIEPARYRKNFVPYLLGLSFLVFFLSLLIAAGYIRSFNRNAEVEKILRAKQDWEWPIQSGRRLGLFHYVFGGAPDAVLFLGDSNMIQYWPRIAELGSVSPVKRTELLADGGCVPVPGFGSGSCPELAEKAMRIAADPSIKTVVLSALWSKYFLSETSSDANQAAFSDNAEELFASLEKSIREFRQRGLAVYLVLEIPSGGEYDLDHLIVRGIFSAIPREAVQAPLRSRAEARRAPLVRRLREIAFRNGVKVIDPFSYLCDATVCEVKDVDGTYRYFNGAHLANSFVFRRVSYLDETVR